MMQIFQVDLVPALPKDLEILVGHVPVKLEKSVVMGIASEQIAPSRIDRFGYRSGKRFGEMGGGGELSDLAFINVSLKSPAVLVRPEASAGHLPLITIIAGSECRIPVEIFSVA